MPQKRNSPPAVMTRPKASRNLIIAALLDALRYAFLFFWFLGPALAAVYCTAKVSGTLEVWTFGVLSTKTAAAACSAGALALGATGSAAFIAFGTIMAMVVGFAGWLIMIFILRRPIAEHPLAFLWVFAGLGASVLAMAWGVLKRKIVEDRKAFKKYRQEQAALQAQERNQQIAYLMQAQAAQQEQDEI